MVLSIAKMLDVLSTIFLCVTAILLLVIYVFLRHYQTRIPDVPGPVGWPIIGCFHEVDKKNPHLTLDKWCYEYGDLYQVPLLGIYALVVNSTELIRELYLREPTKTLTAGRPNSFLRTHIMENGDIAACSISDEWKHRRNVTHKLLYGEGIRQLESNITMLLEKFQSTIEDMKNVAVDPSEYVDNFLFENLEIMLTGCMGNPELQHVMKTLDDIVNNELTVADQGILTMYPWIRFLPCRLATTVQRIFDTRETFMTLLNEISKRNPDSSGIYDNFLQVVEEDQQKERNKITMTNVKMILTDFILGGYLTTRGSLMSVIKVLMSRKDIQVKLQKEIDSVIGPNRCPRLADRENCPYTEATILETLRYITHTPFSGHYTLDEIVFKGVKIPKNTTIVVNYWHLHHSEEDWEDPFMFKPERFLDEDGNLQPATYPARKRLLTFGIGRRSCIGEVFAKSRIFLFLASLMQRYTILPPTDKGVPLFHPTDMEAGFVLQPTCYKCKFIPRETTPVVDPGFPKKGGDGRCKILLK